MRSGSARSGRAEYYDRNPSSPDLTYVAAGVAPHGTTQRAARTIAAGKKCYLETLHARIRRQTAAAPVGQVKITITYQPSGGTDSELMAAYLATNNVNDNTESALTAAGLCNAGDVIAIYTTDQGAGGTIEYNAKIKATEFDA